MSVLWVQDDRVLCCICQCRDHITDLSSHCHSQEHLSSMGPLSWSTMSDGSRLDWVLSRRCDGILGMLFDLSYYYPRFRSALHRAISPDDFSPDGTCVSPPPPAGLPPEYSLLSDCLSHIEVLECVLDELDLLSVWSGIPSLLHALSLDSRMPVEHDTPNDLYVINLLARLDRRMKAWSDFPWSELRVLTPRSDVTFS